MYARVAIAPDAICEPIAPPAFAKAQYAAILEALNANGSLQFASRDDAKRFAASVRQSSALPDGVSQKLVAALVELGKLGRVDFGESAGTRPLASYQQVEALKQEWSGRVEVAVFDQSGAATLGIPDDEGVIEVSEDLEVARLFALSATRAFSHLRVVADTGHLVHDSPRDVFWRDVLRPLARSSKVVTVVDQYLLGGLWHRSDRRPNSYRWRPEHVVWLLENLDRTAPPGAQVELLTVVEDSDARSQKAEAAAQLVREFWNRSHGGRLDRVRLSVVGTRRGFPHDRHIRFSSGAAITVDAGLDRLREPRIWDQSGMAWGYKWRKEALTPLRDREAQARALSSFSICDV